MSEESLGAWYGRALKPLLYPKGGERSDQSRDISCLKGQLRSVPRPEIEAAVRGARAEVDAGRIRWKGVSPGGTITLRMLLADAVDGGIAHFERFKAAGMKRGNAVAERGNGPSALRDLLSGFPCET